MFAGIDRDYYKGASDKELQDLLVEWDHWVAQQSQQASGSGGGANASAGVKSNNSGDKTKSGPLARGGGGRGVLDSSQDTSTSSVSTGSVFMRHHRYADHTTAYRQSSDPYESSEEARREEAFRSQRKVLGRPFEAGGRAGVDCGKPTRMLLGDCVRELYQAITQDWLDADPMIITTAEDLIVLYFRLTKRRHRDVLRRYMNGCLLRNTTCREYDLRKVPEGWNRVTDDGHIMFTMRPVWVPPQRFLPTA